MSPRGRGIDLERLYSAEDIFGVLVTALINTCQKTQGSCKNLK